MEALRTDAATSVQPFASVQPVAVVRGSSIEWRSPTTGHLVGLTGLAPRGPRGLWAALAAASGAVETGEPEVEVEAPSAVAPVVQLDPEAHVAYLARVALSQAGESVEARTPEIREVARVVDIDAFRARRHTARRH